MNRSPDLHSALDHLPLREVPRQARSRRTVVALLDAADAIAVTQGVAALTTAAVATQAKVPIGTVYRYFDDLDALITGVVNRHHKTLVDELTALPPGPSGEPLAHGLSRALRAVASYVRSHPAFLDLEAVAGARSGHAAQGVPTWREPVARLLTAHAAGLEAHEAHECVAIAMGAAEGLMPRARHLAPADQARLVDQTARMVATLFEHRQTELA